jgi:hypothetical protein
VASDDQAPAPRATPAFLKLFLEVFGPEPPMAFAMAVAGFLLTDAIARRSGRRREVQNGVAGAIGGFIFAISAARTNVRRVQAIRAAQAAVDMQALVREASAQAIEREQRASAREARMLTMTERLTKLTVALVWLGSLAVIAALLALFL